MWCPHCNTSLPVVSSDFENLQPIGVSVTSALPSAEIRLFTANDEVTLEYEDRVRLNFIPTAADLITALEALQEYVRNTAIVNIIDNNGKYIIAVIPPSRMLSFLCSAADKLWRVRLFHSGRFRNAELTNQSILQDQSESIHSHAQSCHCCYC